jgi:ribosomal protein S18 acetylase RimI-like enzyme
MEIRAALPADCRAIAAVHVASWQAAYAGVLDAAFLAGLSIERREQLWRQVLSEQRSKLLVGCRDSAIVGFVSFGPSRDSDAPDGRGELWALYAHPAAWSTGVGRDLWVAARHHLLSSGYSSITVWVLGRNERAIAFYSKAGFQAEAEKQSEVGGKLLHELRMAHAS